MLQKVILETANPVTFDIGNANPDELLILTSVSGLDPADVNLFIGELARDGGYYQGRRVGQRNPVFNFKINPNYKLNIDASDARDLLYRQFLEPTPDNDNVQVRLVDDRRPDRYIQCYTEKLPADIFAQRPTAQVSTLCTDPFLRSVLEKSDSLANGWVTVPLVYDGSADTGLEFTLKMAAAIPNTAANPIMIQNYGQVMKLRSPTGAFAMGDVISVNTIKGKRSIKLNGVENMTMMTSDSAWIYLNQASNQLRTYHTAVGDGKVLVTSYKYRSAWWGV